MSKGYLVHEEVTLHGRRIYINYIRQKETNRLQTEGVMRAMKKEYYDMLSLDQVIEEMQKINGFDIPSNMTEGQMKKKLQDLHTTRHFLQWHDHSTVAGHSHFLVMITWLFDTANHLTDAE